MTEQQWKPLPIEGAFPPHEYTVAEDGTVKFRRIERPTSSKVVIRELIDVPPPRDERLVPTSTWRDRHGDEWIGDAGGLMHSFETAPFPREHVEKKWGPLVPVDRPVPTTDESTPGELIARERARQIAKGYTAEHDAEHGVPKMLEWASRFAENGEHIKAAAMVEAARAVLFPHPPTREQIAEAEALIAEADGALSVVGDGDWTWQDTMLRRLADHYQAVLALIQNGADR